jgi:hypothetical protein
MLNPQPKKAASKPKFGMGALTKPKPTKTEQKVAPPTGQTPRGGQDVQSLASKSRIIEQKATVCLHSVLFCSYCRFQLLPGGVISFILIFLVSLSLLSLLTL